MFKNKKKILMIFLFIGIYILIYYIFHKFGISKEQIRKFVEPYGVYGILVLLIMQIIFSLTPAPDSAMPLIAMLLYGPLGVFVVWIGMFIAALIHYKIGQVLGKKFVLKHFPETEKYIAKLNSKHVIAKLVALRLFSFVSFDVTSYIAGISNISFKTFVISLFIGLIPVNLVLILIGYGLFAQSTFDIIVTWSIIIIVFFVLYIFYKKTKIK